MKNLDNSSATSLGNDRVNIAISATAAAAPPPPHGHAIDRATVRQKITGQAVRFEMTEQTREAVENYLRNADKKPGESTYHDATTFTKYCRSSL